jgi:MSHA biogenesis protein MshL
MMFGISRATLMLCMMPVALTACAWAGNQLKIDRVNDLELQQVRDAMGGREVPAEKPAAQAEIPDFQDYTNTTASNLKAMPLVSVSINENVSVKDALYELAKQANFDIELDPRIQGGVIFSAKNRPFDQVMERISELAGLRYRMEDNMVRVELDTPYSKSYKIDYLTMSRQVTNSVNNNSSVQAQGDSGGTTGGSAFSMTGTADINFWKDLEDNMKQIMDSNSEKDFLKSADTPDVVVPTPMPAETPDAVAAAAPGAGAPPPPATPAPAAKATVDAPTTKPTYSINKQAGVISVFANDRVQRKIAEYLDVVRRSVTSQVLIEAKVIEVQLTDQYATGVNWQAVDLPGHIGLSMNNTGTTIPFAITAANINAGGLTVPNANGIGTTTSALIDSARGGIALSLDSNNLDGLIQAVSKFGVVHGLASPRLTVLNNQSAVLNVAKNVVYFEIDKTDAVLGENSQVVTPAKEEATQKTVPEGVMVNVTPSIDLATGETMLAVRPTITKVIEYAVDPTNDKNKIPVMAVQEFDSVIRLKSGDVAVLGGLLKDTAESVQGGIPGASEVPLIGGLFRNQTDTIKKTELIVLLRATILDAAGKSVSQADRDLYQVFIKDRRPFPM